MVEKFITTENFIEHFIKAIKNKKVLEEAIRSMDILEEI
jgi:hypothetical protein